MPDDLTPEEAMLAATDKALAENTTVVVPPVVAEAAPQPTPVVTVEVTEEPAATEEVPVATVEVTEEPVATDEPEGHAPRRIQIHHLSEEERYRVSAAANLSRAEGITLAEAMARLAPPAKQEVDNEPSALDKLRTELAEIEGTLDQASEDRSLFTKDVRKALARKDEVRDEIRAEEARLKQAEASQVQTAQAKFDSTWDKSETDAKAAFPDHFNKDDSPLTKAALGELAEIMADPNHPDNGRADLPFMLYAKHAALQGIAPAKPAAAAKPNPAQRMLPAGPGARTTPTPVQNEATVKAARQAAMQKAAAAGDEEAMLALNEEELTGKPPAKHQALQLA